MLLLRKAVMYISEAKKAVTSGPWLAGCRLAGMRLLLNFEDIVLHTDFRVAIML